MFLLDLKQCIQYIYLCAHYGLWRAHLGNFHLKYENTCMCFKWTFHQDANIIADPWHCESSVSALCVSARSKTTFVQKLLAPVKAFFCSLNGQRWAYLSTHAVSYRCEQQHFTAQPELRLTKHNTVAESIKIPPNSLHHHFQSDLMEILPKWLASCGLLTKC